MMDELRGRYRKVLKAIRGGRGEIYLILDEYIFKEYIYRQIKNWVYLVSEAKDGDVHTGFVWRDSSKRVRCGVCRERPFEWVEFDDRYLYTDSIGYTDGVNSGRIVEVYCDECAMGQIGEMYRRYKEIEDKVDKCVKMIRRGYVIDDEDDSRRCFKSYNMED